MGLVSVMLSLHPPRAREARFTMKTLSLSSILCLLSSIANVLAGGVNVTTDGKIQRCTVTANGNHHDDVPHIMQAFKTCGTDGVVVFPEDQTYWIATKAQSYLEQCGDRMERALAGRAIQPTAAFTTLKNPLTPVQVL
jgi:hypothetical protein